MRKITKQELERILSDHIVWIETGGTEGRQADLSDAYLGGANLEGANLFRANLFRAKLEGAKLEGASLEGASLGGADLRDANLRDANLRGANLQGADLRSGASLLGANLQSANLRGARLEGANLGKANLQGANLEGADLFDANLSDANLEVADFGGADLRDAYLAGANLEGADLRDAYLGGANLEGANLGGAYLGGANLGGANLEGANLEGAILPTPAVVTGRLASGRKTRALSKLRKQALPLKAGAFKKLFPVEFEQIKAETKGADFTPQLLEQLISKYGMTWAVSAARYRSVAQRLCPNANDVLLLNVDISDEAYTDEQRKYLLDVKDSSYKSGHPVSTRENILTIGWVRYCDFPDRILVEEIQSDVEGVRKGVKDPEFVEQLALSGLSEEQIDEAMALIQPFADRFYEDALGLIFDLAEEQGKKVEMLSFEQKKQFGYYDEKGKFHGPPFGNYWVLPKSMGMKLGPSQAMPELGQVWTYTPNLRKRSR